MTILTLDHPAHDALLAAAKGSYQTACALSPAVPGVWSGANLKGKAGRFGGRYAASRSALLDRANALLAGTYTISSEVVLVASRWTRVLTVC